nr:HAD-IA family hydrolase [Eubacterium sp.]
PYPGIHDLLKRLRAQGVLTAVVSNKADYGVQSLCKDYFPGLFDYAVGEREGIRRKPSPDSVNEVLNKLQIKKKDAVYIGDSDVDFATSQNAGLDAIMVGWGFRSESFLLKCGAKFVVKDTEEVWSRMQKTNLTTLCYIEKDQKYLMMHRTKKEGDINKDKWVGVGGHFEPDETPEECLLRETKEETGLELTSWKLRGIVTFICDRWQTEYMFLYTADGYEGKMTECDEGDLEWIDKKAVYDLPLWEGDKIFFRLLEERQDFFSLKLKYEKDQLVEAVIE